MEQAGEESQLPRVLVAILASGSPHLEACMVSVLAQDYPALEVLVVDVGGARDAGEVAALHGLPVITPPKGKGLAAGANAVLYEPIDHCEWLVFCHDDVALEPRVVRLLIEGAAEAGAVIAGPKVRDWHHPEVLREVGFGVDRYGYHKSLVDPGEVDRGQHDLVRDVFFVSTACVAIHIGFFKTVGGFDAGLDSLEEDLDLCWRARLLGHKVCVVPAAIVYHHPSELDIPPLKHRDAIAQRNRMRVVSKCYRLSRLFTTLLSLLVQDVAEVLFRVATGRRSRIFQKLSVWIRYLLGLGPLLRGRSVVQRSRTVSDASVAEVQTKGSLRIRSALERQIHRESLEEGAEERYALGAAGSGVWEFLLHELTRPAVVFWIAWFAFVVLASRSLLFSDSFPLVGQIGVGQGGLQPLREYFSSWHAEGVGYSRYSPTALLIHGVAQVVVGGSASYVSRLGLPLAYLLGGAGVWANVRRISGPRRWEGAAIATALYSLSAPVVASYERGSLSGIVTAALLPWAVGLVYGPILGRRGFFSLTALLALVTLAMAAFEPLSPVLVVAASLGALLGSLLAGKLGKALVSLVMTIAGTAVGSLVAYPSVVTDGNLAEVISKALQGWPDARIQLGVGGVLRMHTTDLGSAPLGYALASLALGAVFFCKYERLAWVARIVFGTAIPAVGVWLAGQEVLPPVLESLPAFFCLSAFGFSVSAGLGVDALVELGWSKEKRSALAKLALWLVLVVAVVGAGPALLREGAGNLGIRDLGVQKALAEAQINSEDSEISVLWLGAEESLPGNPRPLPGKVGGAYSVTGPIPSLGFGRLAPSPDDFEQVLSSVLLQMQSEGFTRGGKLLTLLGVRYVAVPNSPGKYPVGSRTLPSGVVESLARQLDVSEVRGTRGLRLFRVSHESAVWTATAVDSRVVQAASSSGEQPWRPWLDTELTGVAPAFDSVRLRAAGTIDVRSHEGVLLFKECDPGLQLVVRGERPESEVIAPKRAFGWACLFDVAQTGSRESRLQIELRHEANPRMRAAMWLPPVGIVLLLALAVAGRHRKHEKYLPERLAALGDIEDLLKPIDEKRPGPEGVMTTK